jgi:DNA-binding response OmpR family regulator
LTASALANDRAAYLAVRLDDYLAKPFKKQDLAALLAPRAAARWKAGNKPASERLGVKAEKSQFSSIPSLSHWLRIGLLTGL